MASSITNGSAAAFEVSSGLERQLPKNAIGKAKHGAATVLAYISTTAAAHHQEICRRLLPPNCRERAQLEHDRETSIARETAFEVSREAFGVCRQEREDSLQVRCDEEMKKRMERWKGKMKGGKEDFDKEKQELENDKAEIVMFKDRLLRRGPELEEEKEYFEKGKEKGKKFLERIVLRLRRDLGREELCSQLLHHSPVTPLPTAPPPMAPSPQATPES